MKIEIYNSAHELGKTAAKNAARLLGKAIETNGAANIILATGTSQFETLNQLISENINWSKVTMFHLDEYIGLTITHPASFRKYLHERFIAKVNLKEVYLINGEANPKQECERLEKLISQKQIDVALIGIGENGHLAFNDPPADFETEEPFIIVELDEACRRQQMNEGWFNSLDEVPRKAISMSVKQIMKSKNIICSVPGNRKATAIKNCMEHEVNNIYPASILQAHKNCIVYLDKDSASLLSN
ncbi:MAG: glucosamine-6-phosphate deaminase [Parafilimonas sp.]